jgi:hypothetical protein
MTKKAFGQFGQEVPNFIHCQQCQRAILAKRSTKRFCSGTCRKANSRGEPPIVCDDFELMESEIGLLSQF